MISTTISTNFTSFWFHVAPGSISVNFDHGNSWLEFDLAVTSYIGRQLSSI